MDSQPKKNITGAVKLIPPLKHHPIANETKVRQAHEQNSNLPLKDDLELLPNLRLKV